jgi:hypothetical protein
VAQPSDHWLSPPARWVLAHGEVLVPVAFGLMALLLALLVALAWLQAGARWIAVFWIWRQALAWWRARGGASGRRPGGAGGHREHSARYQAVMGSPGWRRRQAIRHQGRRCAWCGARGRLQGHHLTYARLGREAPGDVVALCPACHARAHGG